MKRVTCFYVLFTIFILMQACFQGKLIQYDKQISEKSNPEVKLVNPAQNFFVKLTDSLKVYYFSPMSNQYRQITYPAWHLQPVYANITSPKTDTLVNLGIAKANEELNIEYLSLKKENCNVKQSNFHMYPEEYVYQIFTFRDSIGDTLMAVFMSCDNGRHNSIKDYLIQADDGWICYSRLWFNLTRKKYLFFEHNGDA